MTIGIETVSQYQKRTRKKNPRIVILKNKKKSRGGGGGENLGIFFYYGLVRHTLYGSYWIELVPDHMDFSPIVQSKYLYIPDISFVCNNYRLGIMGPFSNNATNVPVSVCRQECRMEGR